MSSSKGNFTQKSIDLQVFGYDFEVSSINAQKINIIGGLVVNDAHDNVKIGTDAGFFLTSGHDNVLLGNNAGYYTTTGAANVALGHRSGYSLGSAVNNVLLGNYSGYYVTGDENLCLGTEAGKGSAAWSGKYNVFLGNKCGYTGPNDYNTAVGYECGYTMGSRATQNTMVGYQCGRSITSADQSTMIGVEAGFATTTSNAAGYSVVIDSTNHHLEVKHGPSPLGPYVTATITLVDGSYTIAQFITQFETQLKTIDAGFAVAAQGDNGLRVTNATAGRNFQFLFKTGVHGSDNANDSLASVLTPGRDTSIISSSGIPNYMDLAVKVGRLVLVGYRAGYNCNGYDSVMLGTNAGKGSASYTNKNCVYIGTGCAQLVGGGDYNTAIGFESGYSMQAGATYNALVGYRCGREITTGDRCTMMGVEAGLNTTSGVDLVSIGYQAGYGNVSGQNSVMIGSYAGRNSGTASWCVYIGMSCAQNQASGNYNTAVGYECGYDMDTNSLQNTLLGYQCGKNLAGSFRNCMIGVQAGLYSSGNFSIYGGNNYVDLEIGAVPAGPFVTHALVLAPAGSYTAAEYAAILQTALRTVDVNFSVTVSTFSMLVVALGTAGVQFRLLYLTGANSSVGIGNVFNNATESWVTPGNSITLAHDYGRNVLAGFQSGYQTLGHDSVCLGSQAGAGLSYHGASKSVIIGSAAASATGGGCNTVAIGFNAAYNATATSADLVAIGSMAGYNCGSPSNVCIGTGAGKGAAAWTSNDGSQSNVIVGWNAGVGISGTVAQNVLIGVYSGRNLANGAAQNTCVGTASGMALTTGIGNTIVGTNHTNTLTTGTYNVLVGAGCGGILSTGHRNVFIGMGSTTDSGGLQYGVGIGEGVTISGDYGVAIGRTTSAATSSVAIGQTASAATSSVAIGQDTNAGTYGIAIGYKTTAASRSTVIGSTDATNGTTSIFLHGIINGAAAKTVYLDASGQISAAVSSARYKTEVHDYSADALSLVNRMRPVTFKYKESVKCVPGSVHIGLIAEEVQPLFPSMTPLDAEGLPSSVNYDLLVVPLIAAVKQLTAKIATLESRLAAAGL